MISVINRSLNKTFKRLKSLESRLNRVDYHYNRGRQCSISGKQYEVKVYNVVNNCSIDGVSFNTQTIETLGGSSHSLDIVCWYNNIQIGIEVKKYKTPDWIQCCIYFNNESNKW